MARELRYAAGARRNLSQAFAFIAEDNLLAAQLVAARIDEAARRLLEFPGLGAPCQRGGLRCFAIAGTPFHLIYRPHAQGVTILRTHHGARQWPPAPG